LTDTLWEDFEISYGKFSRREILASNKEEREVLSREMTLRNLFLLRRVRDPGFSRHVVNQLRKRQDVLSRAKRYIAQAYNLLDSSEEREIFLADSIEASKGRQDFATGPIMTVLPFEGLTAMLKGFEENRKKAVEYLKWRADRALEVGDDDELASVNWFATEMATGLFNADFLFTGHELYEGLGYHGKWHLELAGFMTLNVKYSRLYFAESTPAVAIANMLVFEKMDIARFFLKALDELDSSLGEVSKGDPMKWNKYLNNAESIAAVTWFTSLPLGEKIGTLNAFYHFEIEKEQVSHYLEELPDEGIIAVAQGLFANHFYHEAKEFYEFCLSRSDSKEVLHVCADGAATAMRQLMEFGEAQRLYEKDLEIAGGGGFPNSSYATAIAHKNIGEMAHRAGDLQKGNEHFEKCLLISAGMALREKAAVLWNLACAHRRIGDYDKELRYLAEALDGLDERQQAKEAALMRIIVLNNPEFCLPNGKCNVSRLAAIDLDDEIRGFRQRALASFLMFQFTRAREWHAKCARLQDLKEHSLDVAELLYLEDRLAESKAAFDASLVPETKSVSGLAYRGLIEFAGGNESLGREYLQRSLVRCVEVLAEKEYFTSLWNHALSELLRMKGEEFTRKLMEEISRAISDPNARAHVLNILGERFSALGFLDASLECFDGLFKLNLSPQSNAMALVQRGTILSRWGRFDEAIAVLDSSIAIWDSDEARLVLADSYAWTLDFKRASDTIRVSLDRHPGDPLLLLMSKRYEALAKEVISFNTIDDPEVSVLLRSGEMLAVRSLEELNTLGSFDYSLSLVEYGKAVEAMLHTRVGQPACDTVKSIYRGSTLDKHLNARKGPDSLPPPVRDLLMSDGKSIGVGGWARIGKDSRKHPSNPVYEGFLREVKARLKSKDLRVVNRACAVISRHRNPSAHRGVMPRESVLAVRKEIVGAVNDIIQEVYSPPPV
jgi:tetratricopeptide (TPR) repeat protein